MKPTNEVVLDLLRDVGLQAPSDFSGLGVLFYSGHLKLPVLPLRASQPFSRMLPVVGRNEVVETLAQISSASSEWHDGFHLLDCDSLALTHVAQFVAPPLLHTPAGTYPQTRGGARHMTAALASLAQELCCAAMLTADGIAAIYRDGTCVREELIRR